MALKRPLIISDEGFQKEYSGTSDQIVLNGLVVSGNAIVSMGSARVRGVAAPTDGNDATNKTYVDNLITGLKWINPSKVLKAIADNTATPPASPVSGDAYVLNGGGSGAWSAFGANDIVEYTGTGWVEVLDGGSLVSNETRVIVKSTSGAGSFASHENDVMEWDGSTWGVAQTATDGLATLIIGENSIFENIGYTYDSTAWVQFTGAGQLVAGNGLTKSGNTINAVGTNGVVASADGLYAQVAGNGIAVSGAGIYLDAGEAISLKASGISVNYTHGLKVSGDNLTIDYASGLDLNGSNQLVALASTGISVGASGIAVDYGNGLFPVVNTLTVLANSGISVDASGVAVNVGAGLTFDSGAVAGNLGNGLYMSGNTHIAALAATGLTADASGISVVVGNGLGLSGDYVAVNYASGITVNGSNELIADAGTGISVDSNGINVIFDSTLSADGSNQMTVIGLPSLFEVSGVAVGATVTAANLDTLTDGSDASALHTHSGLYITLSAAEAIAKADPVYVAANDNVGQACATSSDMSRIIGLASSAFSAGQDCKILNNGSVIQGAFAGGTPGNPYYLNAATAGITANVPGNSGDRIILVGYAINATDLCIQIRDYGQKA